MELYLRAHRRPSTAPCAACWSCFALVCLQCTPAESEVRSQKTGARSQETGVRSQKPLLTSSTSSTSSTSHTLLGEVLGHTPPCKWSSVRGWFPPAREMVLADACVVGYDFCVLGLIPRHEFPGAVAALFPQRALTAAIHRFLLVRGQRDKWRQPAKVPETRRRSPQTNSTAANTGAGSRAT